VFSKTFKTTKTLCQREYLQHSEMQSLANPRPNKLHVRFNLPQFFSSNWKIDVKVVTCLSSGDVIHGQRKEGGQVSDLLDGHLEIQILHQ